MTKEPETIHTSFPLEWRKNWGIERIVLDAIANHLPADSKGTTAEVKLKQEGRYVDFLEADPSKGVEEIYFEDDSQKGYSPAYLRFLLSTKADDPKSGGKFGEGLKLVAIASLRQGVDVRFQSRNWEARPTIGRAEADEGETIEYLCYVLTENGFDPKGSRTIFTAPPDALVREVFQLPRKVLYFNDDYEELYRLAADDEERYVPGIIDRHVKERWLFVKGVYFKPIESLFSYDLGINAISPDRDDVNRNAFLSEVAELLGSCDNVDVIRKILNAAEDRDKLYEEYVALGHISNADNAELWQQAFENLYGKNALLACDDEDLNKDAEGANKVIRLHRDVTRFLANNGVMSAEKLREDEYYDWVDYNDLSIEEKARIAALPELKIKGLSSPPEIKVYRAKLSKSGREVNDTTGVHVGLEEGFIGIKRARLAKGNEKKLVKTWIHETNHHITGAGDYSREFSDSIAEQLAELRTPEYMEIVKRKLADGSESEAIAAPKDAATLKKEKKLIRLIERAYDNKKGCSLRRLVKTVAKAYEGNLNALAGYFGHDNDKLAGIATSAYHLLTGNYEPMQQIEYGGLGAIIHAEKRDYSTTLSFGRNQLHFAGLSGHALYDSENSGNALWFSENSGDALQSSKNSEKSLQCSKNSGQALMYSKNSDEALWHSRNSGLALGSSKNSGKSLWHSENSGLTLGYSENNGESLRYSRNNAGALDASRNFEDALWYAFNSQKALQCSQNHDNVLAYSTNSGSALMRSRNKLGTLRHSRNSLYNLFRRYNPVELIPTLVVYRFDKEDTTTPE